MTGLNLPSFFPLKGVKETALHLAVRLEERSSLALVDFLCQNRSDPAQAVTWIIQLAQEFCWCSSPSVCSHHSNCLEKRTAEGNTALHYSVLHHKPESLKLLLKSKASLHTGAILKNVKELFYLLGASSPNNPIFLLYNSELCRRNGPGCCSEASALAVCRPGEALFNHLYTLV